MHLPKCLFLTHFFRVSVPLKHYILLLVPQNLFFYFLSFNILVQLILGLPLEEKPFTPIKEIMSGDSERKVILGIGGHTVELIATYILKLADH
jgi:hypothetical protein